MSDFNVPSLSDLYADVLDFLKARDVDSLTIQKSAVTNPPTGAIKLVRSPVKFQEFSAGVYSDILLDITGGGTGASSASGARTNLGLGTISTQDSNSVNITGGTITSGVNIDAAALTSGLVTQARLGSGSTGAGTKALFDDQTYKTIAAETSFTMAAIQTVGFTAAITEKPTLYPCNGTFNITLPTVVGRNGKRVAVENRSASGVITFIPDAADTIIGQATYIWDFGQYSSIILIADANNNIWYAI